MMENGGWTVLSALGGSILTVIVSEVFKWGYRQRERKNLFRAIISECRYNLSILDEVTNGTVKAQGSFKRMSVEFFKTIRQQSVVYALPKKFLKDLSRVIADLELFNLEVDFVFQGYQNKNSPSPNINETVNAARDGVKVSLEQVLEIAQDELGEEDDEEN